MVEGVAGGGIRGIGIGLVAGGVRVVEGAAAARGARCLLDVARAVVEAAGDRVRGGKVVVVVVVVVKGERGVAAVVRGRDVMDGRRRRRRSWTLRWKITLLVVEVGSSRLRVVRLRQRRVPMGLRRLVRGLMRMWR